MATIQDVARHAHVGVGTVSRVLSGKGYVKDETRRKVKRSIEELNYTPNEMARNLFFRKNGIVAVIVPELSHPFFAKFANSAEEALSERGYQMMVCNAYYDNSLEERYLEMLKQQRVDGLIFGSHTSLNTSMYNAIRRPIVALDRILNENIPCISSDHREGGRLAAEALVNSGCKNVAQFGRIGGKDKIITPSDERHRVFYEVMREHGISCLSYDIDWGFTNVGYYQEEAARFWDRYPDIDGVFATDAVIMAVMQAALARGKRVPEDVKLVGYDGIDQAKLTVPRLTNVVQPIRELAEAAVGMIVDLIEEKPIKNKKIELPVTLYQGDTTTK